MSNLLTKRAAEQAMNQQETGAKAGHDCTRWGAELAFDVVVNS